MEGFDENKGTSETSEERFTRIREARRAFKPGGTGHIDFITRETGTYPALINFGQNENGTSASPEDWIAMYRATYGFNPEYDAPEDEETEAEFRERAIHHAQWVFGPNGQSKNPELLKGILERLSPQEKDAHTEGSQTEVVEPQEIDPLTGTQFEGVPNEKLHHGQSVFGEDGRQHNPDEGQGYRAAFRYYMEQRGWL